MKVSYYPFCSQTAVFALLLLSRGRCKSPLHLHHRLSLATCRLSTSSVISNTVLIWQTLLKSFRIIYIICAINLWFTHCIKLLECSHLLEESRQIPQMSTSKHIQTMMLFYGCGGEDWAWRPDVHYALRPEKEKRVLVCVRACMYVCMFVREHVCMWERDNPGKEEFFLSFKNKM